MKKYTLAVTSPEYWSEIHDALIVDSTKMVFLIDK